MIENISSWKSKRWRAWERAASRWWLSINTQFNDMANRVAILAWVAVIGMPLYYVVCILVSAAV